MCHVRGGGGGLDHHKYLTLTLVCNGQSGARQLCCVCGVVGYVCSMGGRGGESAWSVRSPTFNIILS